MIGSHYETQIINADMGYNSPRFIRRQFTPGWGQERMVSLFFNLIAGIALLIAGRRLFWLFVGVLGFLAGYTLAPQYVHATSPDAALIAAVILGVIGVLVAVFLQRFAVILAGFIAGAYLAYVVLNNASINNFWIMLTGAIILGLIGAFLMARLFDVALVILTSLVGAAMLTQIAPFTQPLLTLIFIILVVIGLAVQFGQTRRRVR
jgi:hypothetical protein